jgi:16S rRNA (cytidine1402-2'-O)-methyltransferase
MLKGELYIVPTPIGNLEDITYRAIKVLNNVDLILCEDTRRTKILCNKYGIVKPLKSYYNYIESCRTEEIVPFIKNGKNVALVSDSGTPGISDPGYLIIKSCIENDIRVIPLPGASAFLTAVIGSGCPLNKIIFLGFLSKKVSKIEKSISEFLSEGVTIVFYESPNRLIKTLELLSKILIQKKVFCVIARELTKIYEEFIRGSLDEVIVKLSKQNIKGEIVVVLYIEKNEKS